ncbi:S53 family peptidase [Streptacidiphilus anmyonensis]|uniref:S53 family peptidase n=1 Tax=Streptacidiphilus anmyonensis TaxID=405782 RepID=UPI0005A66CB0|nr:S53 family peptidase [Streptacidiphilus anmyonensis]
MAKKAGRVALISAGIAAALCVTSPIASAAPLVGGSGVSADTTPKRIGSTPHIPVGAHKTGTTAASTELHLSVSLKPRDPAALEAFIKATTTPGNPQYHHYLATGQFAKVFGPTQQTIDAVKAALRQQGLTPGGVTSDGLSIPVTATAAQAAKAFNTGFQNLTLANGKRGFVATAAPTMPADVAGQVTSVVGLNDVSTYTSHVKPGGRTVSAAGGSAGVSSRTAVAPHASSPAICSNWQTALNNAGWKDTQNYYSPGSLASAYGMPHSYSTGSGQTIAVFELENVDHASLNQYQSCVGTHTPIAYTSVDGGPTITPDNDHYGFESLLDIEDLISLVPSATIHDYMGPDAQNATDQQVLDTYRRIVTDNSAQVISTSWGLCETVLNSADPAQFAAENTIFQEAAAQGQSVVAASGDSGSSDCYRAGVNSDTSLSVDDPASQPYVTGVGGTHMTGAGTSAKETVWNNGASGGAGGGGLSKVWPAQPFQTGFTSAGGRTVPDVSALADPNTGYLLLFTDRTPGDQYYNQEIAAPAGGTSGAAPTWAAAIAQANAASPCLVGRAGYLNPLLYKAASTGYSSAFRDIVSGDNDIADATHTYSATTGYDEASGLGSPKVGALGGALCQGQNSSTFHQLASPTRVVSVQKMTAGQTITANVDGVGSIPTSGVSAVVANITVTGTGGTGWTTGYPAGTARPGVVTAQWTGGSVARKTTATIPVSPNGKFSYYSSQSGTFSIDILGYYTKDATGLGYNPVSPARLLDTRYAVGVKTKTPIVNSTVNFPVGGKDGIPADATAVVLNVSTLYGVGGGSLTAYAGGTAKPGLSQMYWDSSVPIRTNLLVVPVGTDGTVNIAVSGQTHVLADVFGYYYGTGKQFSPLGQTRLASGALAAKTLKVYQVAGVNGIPSGVKAVALTISASGNPGGGYIEAWDDQGTRVDTSATLWQGGQQMSNQVIVPVGADGKIDLYLSTAATVSLDVNGYFK